MFWHQRDKVETVYSPPTAGNIKTAYDAAEKLTVAELRALADLIRAPGPWEAMLAYHARTFERIAE